jgi:putative YhdH/YhfP family quinone oxidoreductase
MGIMSDMTFKAMVVEETQDNRFKRYITKKTVDQLTPGDVTVKVVYSSLNYKDALSATGNRGVTKRYPHTPGIDAAGVVTVSASDEFAAGDEVIVTSYDLGMNTSGGFGQYIRVPAGWVVPLPTGLTLRESMIYGTAGFTAALSVLRLIENDVTPDLGDVLVSGATGGVGSVAVSILSKIGYSVTAVNGVVDESHYLRQIGAQEVISIEEAADKSGRPLLRSRWAGSVDTVGGEILASTVKSTQPAGTVTCCGNVASPDLPLNVFPFILRGVTLIGIDSQNCPMPYRRKAWEKIAGPWKIDDLASITSETTLDGLSDRIDMMLEGRHKGRTIVRVSS